MTRGTPGSTCLVAVDGSPASVSALVWGLRHAADRGLSVQVLTVWPPSGSALIREVPGHFSYARWTARSAQEAALRQALDEVRDAPAVAARLENAEAGAAIVLAAARCAVLVLGSGASDTKQSLTRQVLDKATCEVVLVDPAGYVVETAGHGLRDGRDGHRKSRDDARA